MGAARPQAQRLRHKLAENRPAFGYGGIFKIVKGRFEGFRSVKFDLPTPAYR